MATNFNLTFTAMEVGLEDSAQTAANVGVALNGSAPFTIEAWVKFEALGLDLQILTQQGVCSFYVDAGQLVLVIGQNSAASDAAVSSVSDLGWHHVCVTYDGVATAAFFIDGARNRAASLPPPQTPPDNTAPTTVAVNMAGFVRMVRVYDQALSPSQVAANMYLLAPPVANVVAWLDFTQSPPQDLGPSALSITLNGSAQIVDATPSLCLDGLGFARPINDREVNPGGRQIDPYTVQAWVFPVASANPVQVVFSNADLASDVGMMLGLQYDAASDAFSVVSLRGANTAANQLVSQGTIPNGQWSNIATTFDGTTLRIYIGGTVDVNTALSSPIPLEQSDGDCLIGCGFTNDAPDGSTPFTGYIAQVLVWSAAQTQSQIAAAMQAPPAPGDQDVVAIYDFSVSPPRNSVSRRALGIAVDASMANQVSPVVTSTRPPRVDSRTTAAVPDTPLPDIADLCRRLRPRLDRAREADLRALDGTVHAPRLQAAWEEALGRAERGQLPFFVTSHRTARTLTLVCHSARGGRYVGAEIPVEEGDDECTVWTIGLVITVLLGILDLFGIYVKTPPGVTTLIRRSLTNSNVKKALAVLVLELSITNLMSVCSVLYDEGFLWAIVRELLSSLFIWSVLAFFGKCVLLFTPAGWIAYASSLAALALSIGTEILKKPTSCCASVSDKISVILKSVSFCHDPTGASNCALPIRKDATENVNVPEWDANKKEAKDSPAAYAIAPASLSTVTIRAKFVVVNSSTDPVVVSIKADDGGILGAVDPFTLTCGPGSQEFDQLIELTNQTFAPNKATRSARETPGGAAPPLRQTVYPVTRADVSWTWKYLAPGAVTYSDLLSTKHRIYTLLDIPTAPWSLAPNRDSLYLPWTAALDYACNWANGATDRTGAATNITQTVNAGLGLTYESVSGYGVYTATVWWESQFRLTDFLNFVQGVTPNPGSVVNCTDCASIVTTFANLLGCSLTETLLAGTYSPHIPPPQTTGFLCNEIITLGSTAWAYPFSPANAFVFHEVATEQDPMVFNHVYDACLQVDSSGDPWAWPTGTHTPALPVRMDFDTNPPPATYPIPTPYTAQTYRERLAQNSLAGVGACWQFGAWAGTRGGKRYFF